MKIFEFLKSFEEKSEVALSNDVYEWENYFYKKYSINNFRSAYINQDIKALKNISKTKFGLNFMEFDDGSATEKIIGIQLNNSTITTSQIKLLAKSIWELSKVENTQNMETPGFFRALDFFKNVSYVNQIFDDEELIIKKAKQKSLDDVSFCHNDLIPDNTFFVNNDFKFIDFEYSGYINYHFDIAIALNSWDFDLNQSIEFIKSYEENRKIDFDYLITIRKFLIIFWTKLCDYKYYETKKETYMIIKKYMKTITLSKINELETYFLK